MGSRVLTLSEVRERIRAEHLELRILLAELDDAAKRLIVDARSPREDGAAAALRAAATVFVSHFLQHLAMEEELFVPLLRGLDVWGDVHAERLLHEHAEQRLVLAAIGDDSRLLQSNLHLADGLRGFIDVLTRDMDVEDLAVSKLSEDVAPPQHVVAQ